MARALVSLQSLKVLLNLELATLDGCEAIEVSGIKVRPTSDSDGCNWEVASYSGHVAHQCTSLITALIGAMRNRYNVGNRA